MPFILTRLHSLTVLLAVAVLLVAVPLGQAQDIHKVPCNDLIYVRSKEMTNYLDFPGSTFKPMVKVTISYCTVNGNDLGEETLYETLWYCGANPVGCRRYRDFDVKALDRLYVYATVSSAAEIGACSNAFVRLLLDATLNRNAITAIEVPSDFLAAFVDQLEEENFYTIGKLQVRPAIYIYLPLRDEKGHTKTVVYQASS
jgi:hypothetical protein